MNLEHLVQKERKLLTTAALAKGWKENWKIKKNHCDWLKYINYKKILVHTDTLKIVMGNCYGTNLLLWKLIKVQNQAVTLCFLYELCSEKNSWWGKLFFIVYIYFLFWNNIELTKNVNYSTANRPSESKLPSWCPITPEYWIPEVL